MNRATWTDIAVALAELRLKLAERKQLRERTGVDLASRTICRVLRERVARFDGRRFMRIASK